MNRLMITSALIACCLMFMACQKAPTSESKKEVQTQQSHKEEVRPSDEEKQKVLPAQPSISKTEVTDKQEKKPKEIKPSPLTEAEQKDFDKFGGGWQSPKWFRNEAQAIKYLKLLIKGDHRTIRWYQETTYKQGYGDDTAKKWYSGDIEVALSSINMKENKEGFALALEVLKTKTEYPDAMAAAAKAVKVAHDKSIIPLLQGVAKHSSPIVRLESAGTLLSLGDTDIALPVLDELAEKEGYSSALYYLFSGPGKIIDERGFKIVEKALKNPKAEVRITAVKLLLESNKIAKEKAEEIALQILTSFRSSEEYGITFDSHRGIIPIPGLEKNFEQSNRQWGSDWRAIETSISILTEIKSKKAILGLEKLASNPHASYLSNKASEALNILSRK